MLTTDAQAFSESQIDPRRFEVIFDRYFDLIRRYAYRRVGSEVADEIASETFAQAFLHRDRFDTRMPSARPWLYGIASNLLSNHLREERVRLAAYERLGAQPEMYAVIDIDDRLVAEELVTRLVGAIGALTPGDRDVLLLFAWAELTYEEIGDALAIPVGTVRSRLHRVRRQIRETYETCQSDTRVPPLRSHDRGVTR